MHCALTYIIAFDRRAAKIPLPAHTPKMSESAASFMARNKAELQAVRDRQRRGPEARRARAMMEDMESDLREAEAASDARGHWHMGGTNDVKLEKPTPNPKDTQKQNTLPECLSAGVPQSAKAVRHASHSTVVLVKLKTLSSTAGGT
jgi:hypothetical protein